jgi:hypothetical protein
VSRHLHDERLFECYLAEKSDEALDPPSAEHLADCAQCAGRYAALARFMDGVRADAEADTAAIFPLEDLQRQQQQIAHRLEHVVHPARVISFPAHGSRARPGRSSRLAPRWIAAAAAAGLFIGLYVGTFVDRAPRPPADIALQAPPVSSPMVRSAAPEAPSTTALTTDEVNEEFLLELEFAAERPRTAELLALDELTPHVRPVRTGLR